MTSRPLLLALVLALGLAALPLTEGRAQSRIVGFNDTAVRIWSANGSDLGTVGRGTFRLPLTVIDVTSDGYALVDHPSHGRVYVSPRQAIPEKGTALRACDTTGNDPRVAGSRQAGAPCER